MVVQALAQPPDYNLTDSLREAFAQPPQFTGNLDTRNAFITGRPVRSYGLKGGLTYGKRVEMGIGYHWLRHGDTYAFQYDDGSEELRELRMAYVAAYFEYRFIARKHWEVTLPFVFGIGRSREFTVGDRARDSFNGAGIVVYEPAVVAEYHFLRYFAVGAGVGVRLMVKGNQNIDQQFTSPIWELRFRVKLGKIWGDFAEEPSTD